jgi:hypothetical protein
MIRLALRRKRLGSFVPAALPLCVNEEVTLCFQLGSLSFSKRHAIFYSGIGRTSLPSIKYHRYPLACCFNPLFSILVNVNVDAIGPIALIAEYHIDRFSNNFSGQDHLFHSVAVADGTLRE